MFLFSCLLLELNWLTEINNWTNFLADIADMDAYLGFLAKQVCWRVSTIKMSLPFLVYPAADVHLNEEIVCQKSSSDCIYFI